MSGHPAAMTSQQTTRCGVAGFKFRHGQARQSSHSVSATDEHLTAVNNLERHIKESLVRFQGIDAIIELRALVRQRGTDLIDQEQIFDGFWGTLKVVGQPDAFFGTMPQGKLVFRRGAWENWPLDLPEFSYDPRLPIIFSPYCATLLHEAVGHATEDDYLARSPLTATVGTQISHPELSVMDCPDIKYLPGSMTHDDCGIPSSSTTLIHRGVLVGDLAQDKGVWRRGDFRDLPLIRASNFIVREGPSNPHDWLQEKGYYVTTIDKGFWTPGTKRMRIMCGPTFALERALPIARRDWLMLEFDSLDLLSRIRAVGSDFTVDPHVHWCVKQNQAVPISLASPSLWVEGDRAL